MNIKKKELCMFLNTSLINNPENYIDFSINMLESQHNNLEQYLLNESSVIDFFKNIVEKILLYIKNFFNFLFKMMKKVWDSLRNIFSKIMDYFKKLISENKSSKDIDGIKSFMEKAQKKGFKITDGKMIINESMNLIEGTVKSGFLFLELKTLAKRLLICDMKRDISYHMKNMINKYDHFHRYTVSEWIKVEEEPKNRQLGFDGDRISRFLKIEINEYEKFKHSPKYSEDVKKSFEKKAFDHLVDLELIIEGLEKELNSLKTNYNTIEEPDSYSGLQIRDSTEFWNKLFTNTFESYKNFYTKYYEGHLSSKLEHLPRQLLEKLKYEKMYNDFPKDINKIFPQYSYDMEQKNNVLKKNMEVKQEVWNESFENFKNWKSFPAPEYENFFHKCLPKLNMIIKLHCDMDSLMIKYTYSQMKYSVVYGNSIMKEYEKAENFLKRLESTSIFE